ncbi:MAG: riboflavin biosynthesis protein RibF [Verrucomicrobiota bacterium]|nr:riboflavin biosynthesis protein RibF [Verrucomicrobiota bacterium]
MTAPLSLPATVHGFDRVRHVTDLHLALGIFDGLHLGHRAVINSAIHAAHGCGGVSGVMTFFPHPTRLFTPENPTLLIQPPRQKSHMLRALGVDLTIWKKFTREFAAIPAEDFIGVLTQAMPGLRALHIGENFRFGKGRKGDVSLLVKSARSHGVSVCSVERLKYNGVAISSSRIRQLLIDGDIASVNELLGYRYFCTGLVQPGQQLARQLGFPTLNLKWEPELKPRYGVYAVNVFEVGTSNPAVAGVANYGVRPTVAQDSPPVLEVHLFDTPRWSVGSRLHVEWLTFIRPEMRFDGIVALKAQIAKDCDAAISFFHRG